MLITIALFMYSSHSHSIKCSFYSIYFFIPFESQRFEKPCNFFMGQQTIQDNYVIQTLKVLEQQTCSASLCARWRRLQLYNAHLMNACANKLAYVWAILLHCPCLVFFPPTWIHLVSPLNAYLKRKEKTVKEIVAEKLREPHWNVQ